MMDWGKHPTLPWFQSMSELDQRTYLIVREALSLPILFIFCRYTVKKINVITKNESAWSYLRG